MRNYYRQGLAAPVRHVSIGAGSAPLPGRDTAKQDLANSPSQVEFAGFAYDRASKLVDQVSTDSRDEAADWFGKLADQFTGGNSNLGYVALFDRKDPGSFPTKADEGPLQEFGVGVLTAPVTARPPAPATKSESGNSNLLLGLGIAVTGLGIAAVSKKRRSP